MENSAQNDILPAWSLINTYLADQQDQSLFCEAVKQSFITHTDLITHYRALRAVLLTYLAHQVKGILLIQAVQQDPEVKLANHVELLNDARRKIDVQESRFTDWFGCRSEDFYWTRITRF